MFRERTVFVIGAGASVEVGMPDGYELAKRISRSLHFEFDHFGQPKNSMDVSLFRDVQRLANETNIGIQSYLQEAKLISSGILLAGSIDEYLYRHADKPLHAPLGKLAIFHQLVKSERASKIFVSDQAQATEIVRNGKDTWFYEFANQLCAGRSASELELLFEGVSIISFNYDRCLQRYLTAFVSQAYHVPDSHAQAVIDKMIIHYPFGSIGSLSVAQNACLRFGAHTEQGYFVNRLHKIKTFTENFQIDGDLRRKIVEEIKEATSIVFLGFGFHKQNLDLLTPAVDERRRARQIVATAFGISEPNEVAVRNSLYKLTDKTDPEVAVNRNSRAVEVMRDYRMILTK